MLAVHVLASCATNAPCDDTGSPFDLLPWAAPVIVLVGIALVIVFAVFARRGR
ncbi:hypothetical protein [Leifsonia sp. NPDC058248]|uniref:hypothetical protein n=1 Tax=Leifsonia sp. NPDC058248 TaxID=3346402 RepID=UPI0036DABEF4